MNEMKSGCKKKKTLWYDTHQNIKIDQGKGYVKYMYTQKAEEAVNVGAIKSFVSNP